MKKKLISILITNYNKDKFLKETLKSVINQKFKDYEIIIFDDCSTDNSLNIIKKFKNVKIINNKKKNSKYGPLNQIYGIYKLFKSSRANILCLMDSDDQFTKTKLSKVYQVFKKKNIKCVFNEIKNEQNRFVFKNDKNISIWPSIFPTSCISLKREFLTEFFKYAEMRKFPHLEIDARLAIFSKFYSNQYNILNNKLTIYEFDPNGITAKIKKFSKKWWLRRHEAFKYLNFILEQKKIKFKPNLDYYITNLLAFFFKII